MYEIKLNWKNLKYEIDYETFKAAAIHITENFELKDEAQTDGTDGDSDFCRTKVCEAVANLENIMHRYLVPSTDTNGNDSIDRTQSEWIIKLEYPNTSRRNYNIASLTSKCHRYVVALVLMEWSKLALPNMTEAYAGRMQQEEAGIKEIVYRKTPPTLTL